MDQPRLHLDPVGATRGTTLDGHPARRHSAPVTALEDYLQRRARCDHHESVRGQVRDTNRRRSPEVLQALHSHARHNRLLGALSSVDYERLWPSLELVVLPFGNVVRHAGSRASHGYFPVTGVVSLTQELSNGATAEIAITGNEGMAGVSLLMGSGATSGREFVRSAGVGYRVDAEVLQREFDDCRSLRNLLLRHAQCLITQVAQTAACRGHHSILEQVCRSLLSLLDRSPMNELELTHELVAHSLGVRRESVTAAAGVLQKAGAIRCNRRRITILDRPAIEARACECYAAIRDETARIVPVSRAELTMPHAHCAEVAR